MFPTHESRQPEEPEVVSRPRRLATLVSTLTAAVATGAVSLATPLSYDEAYWLAISRMVNNGATLYVDAIDNKSPLVYATVRLLDFLPGSFVTVRAAFLALGAGLVFWTVVRNTNSWDHDKSSGSIGMAVAAVAVAALALLAQFTLQTELLAVPFLILGLRLGHSGRPIGSVLAAIVATLFTPLAVGAIPLVLWISRSESDRPAWRRAAIGGAVLTLLLGGVIVAVGPLRYGLIELNLASRVGLGSGPDTSIIAWVAGTAASVLALVALAILVKRQAIYIWSVLVLAIPILLAGFTFSHYWIIPLTGLIATASPTRTNESGDRYSRIVYAVVVLLLVPLFVSFVGFRNATAGVVAQYDEVGDALDQIQSTNWLFVQIGLQPYLSARFPDRVALRSPSLNYLVWDTSLTSSHRSELAGIIDNSSVLIDPGLGSGADPIPELAPVTPTFMSAIDEFSCVESVSQIDIRLRPELCE